MALFRKKSARPSHADLDAQTLSQMVKAGAVLTNKRNVRHYLYGRDEAAAVQALSALEAEGYRVESRPAATGGNWLLLAEREEVVNAAGVATARRLFEDLAREMAGGEYDGWEAAIVDGQMERTYPETARLSWRIVIDCQTGAPDARTAELVEQVQPAVQRYGGDVVAQPG